MRWKFKQLWRWMSPALSLITLLVLLAAAFVYAKFQGGFVSWFLFYSFLPVGVYSLLLALLPMRFSMKRQISALVYQAGDDVEVTVTMRRKIPFPLLYATLEDRYMSGDGIKRHTLSFFMGFKRELTLTYILKGLHRGRYTITQGVISAGDVLGIVMKKQSLECAGFFTVHPPFRLMSYRLFQQLTSGGAASRQSRDPAVISGVREYRPGDRFSRIDWKSSARSEGLKTKEFEMGKQEALTLIIDRSSAVHFELVVEIAASLAKTALSRGTKTGALFTGKETAGVHPGTGKNQEVKVFNELAIIQATEEDRAGDIFIKHQDVFSETGVYLFITADLSDAFLTEAVRRFPKQSRLVILVAGNAGTLRMPKGKRGIEIKRLDSRTWQRALAEVDLG